MKEQNPEISRAVSAVRRSIIDSSIVLAATIGAITYLISISRFFSMGFHYSYIVEFCLVLLLGLMAFFRYKLPILVKTYALVSIVFFFSLSDVFNFGLLSTAKIYIVLLPLFSVLFLSLRRSLFLLGVAIFLYLIIGFLYYQGVLSLPPNYALDSYTQRYYPFIINALHIFTLAMVTLVIIRKFLNAYKEIINELRVNNRIISEREKNYRNIFESSGDAILIQKPNGVITDANQAMFDGYGYQRHEVIGKNVEFLSSNRKEYTPEKIEDYIRRVLTGEKVIFEWVVKKKHGEEVWVEVSLRKTTINDEDRILALMRDIDLKKQWSIKLQNLNKELEQVVKERTDELQTTNEELSASNEELYAQRDHLEKTLSKLKEAQQQLIQSEKMASLGVMAAGVAHEINNPINYIHGGITIIEQALSENNDQKYQQLKPYIDGINQGVERTVKIVNTLSQYSQSEKLPASDCEIDKIVDEALFILNHKLGSNVNVVKDYGHENRKFRSNAGKLLQVFVNLLDNAFYAVGHEGKVNIKTGFTHQNLSVFIEDNGCGISENDLPQVFDPFFTTKEPGEGPGLGLSISYNIVKELGGEISIESDKNTGTTVQLIFPVNGAHN